MTAAPCSWTSSASRRSQGTDSSFQSCRLPKAGALPRLTTALPPIMVSATPPLAFSTWYARYRSFGRPSSLYAGSCDVLTIRFRNVSVFKENGVIRGSAATARLQLVAPRHARPAVRSDGSSGSGQGQAEDLKEVAEVRDRVVGSAIS